MKTNAIVFNKNGDPATALHHHSFELPELGPNDVLLKLLAAPINPSDVLMINGSYRTQPTFTDLGESEPSAVGGLEGALEVVKVGSAVKNLAVGDWALSVGNIGNWSTYRVIEASRLFPIKNHENLTPVQAATVTVNPTTAKLMLMDERVGMQKGDYFIQNGANSALGRLAIQFGKQLGFKSINVVRDRSDFDELEKELKNLGADYVVKQEQLDDPQFIGQFKKELGSDANIKLGLNCVGGSTVLGLSALLSDNGFVTTYGSMIREPMLVNPADFVMRGLTCQGYWLSVYAAKNPEVVGKLIKDIFEQYAKGELKDSPFTENVWNEDMSGEEFEKVFKTALTGNGKQVIVFK